MQRVAIVGTGLIGSSVGLALRRAGFTGRIDGIDTSSAEGAEAVRRDAIDAAFTSIAAGVAKCRSADVVVLAVPVLAIMEWLERLGPLLGPDQLITDVGSTKLVISEIGQRIYGAADKARFLPGHPMAGKESGGAAQAQADLFDSAIWLFCPAEGAATPIESEWKGWIGRFGCRTLDLDAARHDLICASVSHLPQMVATALSALFADEFAETPELAANFEAIGGRAMREMTRLGASPYSMWRDVAMTNTEPLAAMLHALEQRLAHMRENLRTPELRDEFTRANRFRGGNS